MKRSLVEKFAFMFLVGIISALFLAQFSLMMYQWSHLAINVPWTWRAYALQGGLTGMVYGWLWFRPLSRWQGVLAFVLAGVGAWICADVVDGLSWAMPIQMWPTFWAEAATQCSAHELVLVLLLALIRFGVKPYHLDPQGGVA